MKTIADFKRAVTLGSKWHVYNHIYGADMGIRTVGKVQSNRFAFNTDRGTLCYCDFPTRDCVRFTDSGVEIYWPDGRHVLTYKAVQS